MNEVVKIIRSDGIPLRPGHKTNVLINTDNQTVYVDGKSSSIKMENPTVLEINTNIPVEVQSRKVKYGLILCISISLLSVILSMALAYHHCVNMSSLRSQVDMIMMKMENLSNQQRLIQESLPNNDENEMELRNYRSEALRAPDHPRVVQNEAETPDPSYNISLSHTDLVVQFNGAQQEVNLGRDPIVGPWVRDTKISTPNSHTKIELDHKHVIIKESGLYLIYAQVVYLTHEPCCYFIWARQSASSPRLLTTCSTANDSSSRPLSKSQISCAVQTVARLQENDIINIAQREHNRTVWMRPGYSYFGFIKLGS